MLIDTHTHIFLTTTCSPCTMLPVCMLLGLIIWYWTISWFPFPRKTTSPAPNISQWALVLSVGLRTCGLSPSFGMSIGVLLVQLTFGSCVSETSWVPLLISLGESLTANSLILWLFQSFWPLTQCSLNFRCGNVFVEVSIGTGLHNSLFWLDIVFCNGVCCREKFPWWGVKTTLMCGYNDECL